MWRQHQFERFQFAMVAVKNNPNGCEKECTNDDAGRYSPLCTSGETALAQY